MAGSPLTNDQAMRKVGYLVLTSTLIALVVSACSSSPSERSHQNASTSTTAQSRPSATTSTSEASSTTTATVVPRTTTSVPATSGTSVPTTPSGPQLTAVSEPRSGALGSTSIQATATLTGIESTQTGSLEFDIGLGPYNKGQPASVESVAVSGPGTYPMATPYTPDRSGTWYVTVSFGFTSGPGTGLEVSGAPAPNNPYPDSNLVTTITSS